MFELLDWNPLAIKHTANLWQGHSSMTLEGLYDLLVKSRPTHTKDGVSVALAAQVKQLELKDTEAYNLL